MLDSLLPRNRVKVLRLLLGNPSNHYYLREIARACGVPLRAAQREMALYEAMGLVQRVPRGRQVFFAVETGHPLFAELRALIEKASPRSGASPPVAPPVTPSPADQPAAIRQVAASPPRRERSWRVW
jgi:DNA-binding transcriptional ArsR family regulator